MYDDPFQPRQGGLASFLKLLSASFPVGRFFGVDVRIYWITLIIMPLIVGPRVPGMAFLETLTHTATTILLLYLIIYAHEMSHVMAGRRYKMHTPLITLSPLGGTAHMATPAPNPKAEAFVALAGPASHLVWLAVFAPLWWFVFRDDYAAYQWLRPAGWVTSPVWYAVATIYYFNLTLMIFNLLPFFPMDGGRTLRAVLAQRMHPNRATLIATQIGIGGAVLFIVGGFAYAVTGGSGGGILIALGITHWMACVQERRAARHSAGPYDATASFEPWQLDPDAWKRGGEPDKPPGYFEKRRRQKADQQRRSKREAAENLEAEVDRILDKVNRVGMAGLSEKEKRVLTEASKARRRR